MKDVEPSVTGPLPLPGVFGYYETPIQDGTVWVAKEPFGRLIKTSPYGVHIAPGGGGLVYTLYVKVSGFKHGEVEEMHVRRI